MKTVTTQDADGAWLDALRHVFYRGARCAPRGQACLELEHRAVAVDMTRAVVTVPERKLNHRFMAAEAWWILSGRDDVESLAAYNPRMREFSDDGATLAGAYGPRIVPQLPYVARKLAEDPDTRQATLTVWTPDPAASKDIPCTVAMDFKLRRGRLNAHVFMRSSDLWLGLPYDLFSFSAVGVMVTSMLNVGRNEGARAAPGTLYVTAASQHVYERDLPAVEAVLDAAQVADEALTDQAPLQAPLPPARYAAPRDWLETLAALRDSRRGDARRWWEATP